LLEDVPGEVVLAGFEQLDGTANGSRLDQFHLGIAGIPAKDDRLE
jgi:hypothetical protein